MPTWNPPDHCATRYKRQAKLPEELSAFNDLVAFRCAMMVINLTQRLVEIGLSNFKVIDQAGIAYEVLSNFV